MKQNYTVRTNALEGVEAFLIVARLLNFRRAAAELGVTPSAVGQAVRNLEQSVGAPLFTRTTRSVSMTEVGQRFLERAKPAFDELVDARADARDRGARPAGLLRLAVPRAIVPLLLEPVIAGFCHAYPEIELEIAASEQMVDIAKQGFDAGIRMGQLIATDMVAIRLTPPFPMVTVGSPAYILERGIPSRPEDLRDHACIRLRLTNGALGSWNFLADERAMELSVGGPLIAHDYPTALGAARMAVGLAQVPGPLATADVGEGRLVRVLDEFAAVTPGVFLYHTGKQQMLPKLRAFIDYIRQQPLGDGS